MGSQVACSGSVQDPIAAGIAPGYQQLTPGVADHQQDARGRLTLLRGRDPVRLAPQPLTIVKFGGLGALGHAEPVAELLQIAFQCLQIRLGGEGLDPHAGAFELLEYRRRPHFLGADEDIRTQRQHALGSQLALVADARQLFQRLRMLAGGVHPDQLALAAQRHYPFAQRAARAHPALRQLGGLGHAGAEQDAQRQPVE